MRKSILSIFFLSLFINSCYEPVEGCLDTFASNYDVLADEDCEDCCTYPSLNIRFAHREGEEPFTSDSILQDTFGNDFAIRQFEFFIYDVDVLLSNGDNLEVSERVLLNLDGTDAYFRNDFKHINLKRSTYNLGTASSDGTIQEISFNVGLDASFDNLDFTGLSSSFELKIFEDSLYVEDHFVDVELEIERDTAVMDTMTLQVVNQEFFTRLTFEYSAELEKGEDITIPLQIDYSSWFNGINARTDDVEKIGQILSDNLSSAFSIL